MCKIKGRLVENENLMRIRKAQGALNTDKGAGRKFKWIGDRTYFNLDSMITRLS